MLLSRFSRLYDPLRILRPEKSPRPHLPAQAAQPIRTLEFTSFISTHVDSTALLARSALLALKLAAARVTRCRCGRHARWWLGALLILLAINGNAWAQRYRASFDAMSGADSPDLPSQIEAPLPDDSPLSTSPSLEPRPQVLRAPAEDLPTFADGLRASEEDPWVEWPRDLPPGYAGPSGILPREAQADAHFVPLEDRWRIAPPEWDRYGNDHPPQEDSPYDLGRWWDPYHQNVLKGDYPIVGQHTFLNISAASLLILEERQVPTPTSPFESTVDPFQEEFFGNPNQFFYSHYFKLSVDLSHGDAAFKPADWRVKLTPVFNLNYLDTQELGIVNANTSYGRTRHDNDFALEEWFVETKLADTSPNYDFVSFRGGSQFFSSDFRGLLFNDTNRALRLFGTQSANQDQFNLLWFDQTEKDTNSLLNTFDDRHQNTLIANYYRQDFLFPGYTAELSYHYNRDQATRKFDKNGFLVRPDPVGVFAAHQVSSHYLGWAGQGHIDRVNISHAAYYAFGEDKLNPLAGRETRIDAWMGAIELSYDRDWIRFRTSGFYASGDPNINDGLAQGFDTIFDNPNFAGGEFSYWQRQQIKLQGVNLVQRMSLVPDLRSSKFQGQTNFVNPGLYLLNFGMDADITPKLKAIGNVNFLWFDQTEVLEQFVFQDQIDNYIGTDLSLGCEYRPLLSNNITIVSGVSCLVPGDGFKDLYDPLVGDVNTLFAGFLEVQVAY